MNNKKDLNIWLLILSLITIITLLLPFAEATKIGDIGLWLKIEFYATLSIFIVSIVAVAVISLICLIKDNFTPMKVIEGFVLLAFTAIFINVVVFACIGEKLSPGYAVVAVEAFIMASLSQICRVLGSSKEYGGQLLSLFRNPNKIKKEKKQKESKVDENLLEKNKVASKEKSVQPDENIVKEEAIIEPKKKVKKVAVKKDK